MNLWTGVPILLSGFLTLAISGCNEWSEPATPPSESSEPVIFPSQSFGPATVPIVIEGDPASKAALEDLIKNQRIIVHSQSGMEYHLRVLEPDPSVDYKIVQVRPDPSVDYKIIVLDPEPSREITDLSSEEMAEAILRALKQFKSQQEESRSGERADPPDVEKER